MNTPQHVTVKQYLVWASPWLDVHAEPVPDTGIDYRHRSIGMAAVEMSILIENSGDEGAERSPVLSVALTGFPACEGAPNDSLQSWAWLGLPSSTIRSEPA